MFEYIKRQIKKIVQSRFEKAIFSGDYPTAKFLVKLGADPNCLYTPGYSILRYAVKYRKIQAIEPLIKLGADPNCVHTGGYSTLQYAIITRVKAIELLIKAGADLNYVNHHGLSALQMAARYGMTNTMVQLIKAGADLNYVNRDGFSALQIAVEHGMGNAVAQLIEAGADPNHVNDRGQSVLEFAIRSNKLYEVEFLLELAYVDTAPYRHIASPELLRILDYCTAQKSSTALVENAFISGYPYEGIVIKQLNRALSDYPFLLINYYAHRINHERLNDLRFSRLPQDVVRLISNFIPPHSIFAASQLSREAADEVFEAIQLGGNPPTNEELLNRLFIDTYHEMPLVRITPAFSFKTSIDNHAPNFLFFANKLIENKNTIHYVASHIIKPILPESVQNFTDTIELPEIPILAWAGAHIATAVALHFSTPFPTSSALLSTALSTCFFMSQHLDASPYDGAALKAIKVVAVVLSSYTAGFSPVTVDYLATGVLEALTRDDNKVPHTNSSAEKFLPYVADIAALSLGAPLIYQSHTTGSAPTTITHSFSLLKKIALTHHVAEILAPLVVKHMSDAMDTAYEYWEAAKQVDWLAVLCPVDMVGSSTTAAENLEI